MINFVEVFLKCSNVFDRTYAYQHTSVIGKAWDPRWADITVYVSKNLYEKGGADYQTLCYSREYRRLAWFHSTTTICLRCVKKDLIHFSTFPDTPSFSFWVFFQNRVIEGFLEV